jgi:hypothetical protein
MPKVRARATLRMFLKLSAESLTYVRALGGNVKGKMLIVDRHWTCDGYRLLNPGRST